MPAYQLPVISSAIAADTANTANAAVVRAADQSIAVGLVNATAAAVSGYLNLATASKTTTATADASSFTYLCDATSAAFAITLPAASAVPNRVYAFVKTDSSGNAVTITGAGTDNINGSNTKSLASQFSKAVIQSNGTQWYVLS